MIGTKVMLLWDKPNPQGIFHMDVNSKNTGTLIENFCVTLVTFYERLKLSFLV